MGVRKSGQWVLVREPLAECATLTSSQALAQSQKAHRDYQVLYVMVLLPSKVMYFFIGVSINGFTTITFKVAKWAMGVSRNETKE